jgi:hypothetical protein
MTCKSSFSSSDITFCREPKLAKHALGVAVSKSQFLRRVLLALAPSISEHQAKTFIQEQSSSDRSSINTQFCIQDGR